MRILLALVLPLAACAGADPASEPPVELKPGLYEISIGGGTFIELPDGQRTSGKCLGHDAALDFTRRPLAVATKSWPGCSEETEPRQGNAIKGKRVCPETSKRSTSTLVEFTGSHSDSSFEFAGWVSQGEDEGNGVMHLGSGEFKVTGKRVGDC